VKSLRPVLELNPQQERAAGVRGHCLITACPGSGKTALLAARAARLLSDAGRVAAVTFTRDAAGELKKRVRALCPDPPGKRLIVGTFHSLALFQLRRHGMKVRILSAAEQFLLMRRIWEQNPDIYKFMTFEMCVKELEAHKSIPNPPDLDSNSPFGMFYTAYTKTMCGLGAFDFADIVLNAVQGMQKGSILPYPTEFLLVDESQDLDLAQVAWVKTHAESGAEVTIVGDDDQSIYGWRHALGYRGMMAFVNELGASQLELTTNYRCSPDIINVAVRLISKNKERVQKNIVAHKRDKGEVEVIKTRDRWDESNAILRRLKGCPDEGWAILARTNRLLDAIEINLRKAKIKSVRVGGRNFWESRRASIYLGLLSSIAKDDGVGDVVALQWAGFPHTYCTGIPLQKNIGGDEVLACLENACDLDKAAAKLLKGYMKLRQEWQKALRLGRTRLVVSGVTRWLIAQEKDIRKGKIFLWCEEALMNLEGSLEQRIFLLTQNDPKEDGKGNAREGEVYLMTLHASKGLEFQNVWIVAMEQGILPHGEAAPEEERRLAYVGFTRAQRKLFVSYSTDDATPSQFLAEAGILSAL